jgi:8-hydroxy-5-deazaflavin:NADPH oxidoreductase
MDIAIIGAGNVGAALGGRLIQKGHRIRYGVPNPADEKYAALKSSASSTVTTPAEAAKPAHVVLLATPWGVTKQAIEGLGSLVGKILVDCTNPIKADFSGLEVGHTTSGAEIVAGWAKDASVVKCFNQTGFNNMAEPAYDGRPSVMFAAGDDADALRTVASLARDVGFDAVALKGLHMARQLEQLAWLWIAMAAKQGFDRDFAFAMLRR